MQKEMVNETIAVVERERERERERELYLVKIKIYLYLQKDKLFYYSSRKQDNKNLGYKLLENI